MQLAETASVSSRTAHSIAKTLDESPFTGQCFYLIGIGGCGMSGLALMLKRLGAICSGSDTTQSDFCTALQNENIPISFDQSKDTLPNRCDIVITSAAIQRDNPQLIAAQKRGIPVWSYAEALGNIQQGKIGVSIAGTHGKSTVTAMLAHILIECNLDPSFIIGANCPQIGGSSRTGNSKILLAEACEFNRSFHKHRPTIALINSVEEDHLDIYGSLDEIIEAFTKFAQLIPPTDDGGRLLIAHDGAHRVQLTAGLKCKTETFGFHPEADYQVTYEPNEQYVEIRHNGAELGQWITQMPGAHNALNTAAAAILAHYLGGEWKDICRALSAFRGLDRRMQRLGTRRVNGGKITVYDDYGHHPTEIDTTLRALRSVENPDRMICVFQPHQHSRTRFLMEQFAQSFSSADVVIVPHIYFVRDSEIEKTKVSAADLVDQLRKRGVRAMHVYPFEAIVEQLETICRDGDLLVIMGAGPVWKVARQFMQNSES